MKVAVVLPRKMVFSPQGATSIDLCALDFTRFSRHREGTTVYGAPVEAPFDSVRFRPVAGSGGPPRARDFIAALRADRPDVVTVHQHLPTAAALARALPCPVILHKHGKPSADGWFRRLTRRRDYARCARIVFISEYTRGRFSAEYPALAARAVTVPNGIDPDLWRPSTKERDIVFAGRAQAEKGVLTLIDAFGALPEAMRAEWRLRLLLVASNDAERAIAARAEGAGALVVRNQGVEAVHGALAQAAIAAVPSIAPEGFPRAVLEAAACGCAIIGTRAGGLPEVLGDDGIYVPAGDAGALSAALAALMQDAPGREAFGARARSAAQGRLHIRAAAAAMDDVIDALI